jgi:hypothetical protein
VTRVFDLRSPERWYAFAITPGGALHLSSRRALFGKHAQDIRKKSCLAAG